ncbi:MAG: GyrI-like domain-containing protein [Candidatus Aminicenantes bacterium]|nr:MAG: GyrI-like domain-containing protein [Candidatus Aminicenantes bacterium]
MKKIIPVFFLVFFLVSQVSLEAAPKGNPGQDSFSIEEITPFSYVCISHKGPFSDMEKVIGMLQSSMQSQNIRMTGAMFGVYYSSPQTVRPEELVWEVGFPVDPEAIPRRPLEKKLWNFTNVLVGLHIGPYSERSQTIDRMRQWMRSNNYVPDGPVLEKYLDMDPSMLLPQGLRTEIWIPCRKGEGNVFLKVKSSLANVRSGPGLSSSVLAQLKMGAVIESSGMVGEYYEIALSVQNRQPVQAFVDKKDVEVVSGREEVKQEITEPVPPIKEETKIEEEAKIEEQAQVEEKPKPVKAKKPISVVQGVKKVSLEFGFYYSLMNSYKRGILDEWFAEVTGDPTRLVDQGSPAFFSLSGTMFFDISSNFALGVGADVHISSPHALWGTQIFWGGRQEVVLKPFIIGVKMPLRIKIGTAGMMMSITVSPALLTGWVTGTYDNSATLTYWEFTPSSKMGFGLSGGLETFFGKSFGFGVTAGFRSLTVGLAFEDPSSSTGYSSPTMLSGELVTVDLGGTYMTTGLLIRF